MYNIKKDAISINFKNSKTSDPEKLLINLKDKINIIRSVKYVALSNPSMYSRWKNIKS